MSTPGSAHALAHVLASVAIAAAGVPSGVRADPAPPPAAAAAPAEPAPQGEEAAAPPASAAKEPPGAETPLAPEKAAKAERAATAEKPSLDFDLLGAARPPPEPAEAGALRLRRTMLTVHQGIGLGLLGLQFATTTVGQLHYSDKFRGPDTGRFKLSHRVLAYSTLGAFAVNGALALLAPSPGTPRKLDRVMVHRLSMLAAAGGMVAQVFLGVRTRERVGRLDQEEVATVHLAVGYATLAAVLTGVGALVL